MTKRVSHGLRRLLRSPSVWLALVILAYVAVVSSYNDLTQPSFTVIVRDTTEQLDEFFADTTVGELKASHEFALLSAAVYGKETSHETLCNDGASLAGWTRWKQRELLDLPAVPEEAASWHRDFSTGLAFEVYTRNEPTDLGERLVAIVFRGTDGGLSDLWSNLHWLTRWIPFTFDQYDVVRTMAPALVARIRDHDALRGQRLRIVAAGHSLGGGLAHQAAYAADGIGTVYAFDSSSVTGFYDVGKADRDRRAREMRIYRIYERGEVLAYLRRFMAQIYPVVARAPKIVEARYNFEGLKGNFISLHSMENLACNLREVALGRPERI